MSTSSISATAAAGGGGDEDESVSEADDGIPSQRPSFAAQSPDDDEYDVASEDEPSQYEENYGGDLTLDPAQVICR